MTIYILIDLFIYLNISYEIMMMSENQISLNLLLKLRFFFLIKLKP